PSNKPSLVPSRPSPFCLWETKVPTNRQGNRHLGQKFRSFWLREDGGPMAHYTDHHLEKKFGQFYLRLTVETMDRQDCDGLSPVPSDT
ncbi:hypothetical protein HAX54_049448, partial [Datura stramonium]|nr:hypothetical protein [Datura stramonium]